MEFVEAPAFSRHMHSYLDDEEYRELQRVLAETPELGDVIEGTGGFRKVRWSDVRRGKGKRGGLRIIYFHFKTDEQVWLMTVYGKDQKDDLTPVEKKALKAAIGKEVAARRRRTSPKG
ncbi:MAG: toxin [Pseudomonadota bacterium]